MRNIRLFIAINFNSETRSRLVDLRDTLRLNSTKGRFSTHENLHLTLAFLGECEGKKIEAAKAAMDAITFKPFTIEIAQLGYFNSRGGEIRWAGVTENKELMQVQRALAGKLTEFGFKLENRPYRPHITLGRDVITKTSPHMFDAFGQTVNKIELMRSEHVAGKLTYTPIHEVFADGTKDL